MAAQIFIRWSRLGVWERLLALVQERGVQLGMTFLDGTNMELEDMDTRKTLKVSARHLKPQYLETLKAHGESLQAECHTLGVKMVAVETTLPYFQAMRRMLQGS